LSSRNYLKRRIQSIKIALDGIWQVIVTEENARIHALATLIVFLLAFLLGCSIIEWVILVLVVGFVWSAEIFNTAIEELVDLVNIETTPAAKKIKDASAGAVLITAIISLIIGLLIFGPKLWSLIAG
jgi:diacylglycerol kinase